ncbi:MAG: type II secretion system protein [Clostridium sp.]|uniref:type II secretion system protein n=1 Tax=Clostridium sp. TaxID=1506 RepID=UPI0025E5A324|nr:type II secretion system protein [Clostridium sp.]MCI6693726.1 type II secretion system protein [Clostridium sp.]MDY4251548.1 type II secretion system protein [Clostridium sp.]
MKAKSKRLRIKRIRITLLLIISAILGTTLFITYNNYKKMTKKIEVKESIREFILTVNVVEINDSIEFEDSDTLYSIKNKNDDKLKAIAKYKNIDNFNKIELLTIEEARKILKDEVDFEINKNGEFLNVYIKN